MTAMPCPFCGDRSPVVEPAGSDHPQRVRCEQCGAQSPNDDAGRNPLLMWNEVADWKRQLEANRHRLTLLDQTFAALEAAGFKSNEYINPAECIRRLDAKGKGKTSPQT